MKDKINYKKVNEVVSLTSKILNLVYIAMIIGIIFIATLLIKEWGILKFVMTILKVATPFFIGFVIAWLFNPLVVKLENRGWNRAIASMVIFLVFFLLVHILKMMGIFIKVEQALQEYYFLFLRNGLW